MNKVLLYWNNALLWIVVTITKGITFSKNYSFGHPHFSTKEQIIFIKRLSMMLRSGMPIMDALRTLEAGTAIDTRKSIIRSLISDIASGLTLSSALEKHTKSFGAFCINMVKVGEASGTLPLNLEYITVELGKKNELRKQIVGALLYPFIIVLATLGITIFLILYIFPKILPIFTSLHVALPLSTRILIGISEFLKSYWPFLGGFIVLFIFLYPQLRNKPGFRYKTDALLLRVPIFGRLCLYYHLSNTLRTLGLLVQHEVAIVEALTITTDSSDHLVFKKVLKEIQVGVMQGQSLASQLGRYPLLFPSVCTQMITSGEATGNLGTTLEYVSSMYEADMRDAIKNLTTILEPLLMLTMGLCVGFIAVSIITPIYGITQNLHQ